MKMDWVFFKITRSQSSGGEGEIKNRGIVEEMMAPSQIEKAQDLSREWMRKH
jgi:hypothetical protein